MSYLKHLFELYREYMGMALVGMLLSAIVLSSYSAVRSGSIVWTTVGGLVLLLVVLISINVVRGLYRSWLKNRVTLKRARGELALIELVRFEQEAQYERNEEKLEEARKYLRFLEARGIRDYREPGDERLLNDVAELLEQLHAENVSEASISEAVDKFITRMEQSGNSGLVPADRSRIIGSIVSDTVMNENKDKEGKFIS